MAALMLRKAPSPSGEGEAAARWQQSPFHYLLQNGESELRRRAGRDPADFPMIEQIAADAGGSIVSQSVAFSGPLGFLFGPLMGNQLAGHFEPVLADLSSAAERSDTESA